MFLREGGRDLVSWWSSVGQAPVGLEGSGACGAVGIGAGPWAVLSSIPEG